MRLIDSSAASGYLDSLPLCMISLNPDNLQPIAINELFERYMGPLYKFEGSDFCLSASDDKNSDSRTRFRAAIEEAIHGDDDDRVRIRNVEMTTLSEENSGFPIRKFFDWFISRSFEDGTLLLLGDPCSDQDVSKREKDAELIDFFQNAPIALHWLSGEGKVLWANQTELNVLGYTAEEYIGKEIMQFCPDDEELVLEIFKQLGSGNTIKDVPVRFRTKDGKIVHLLIDSNVRYEKDGSFGHTRCFIRDDTGRKIRESRATLLLEETKRSLAMLDNFMARSLHHLKTPLHVTMNTVESIDVYFKNNKTPPSNEAQECMELVKMSKDQISQTVRFLDDVTDLAKFDQGAVLHLNPVVVDWEQFGREILKEAPVARTGVQAVLELRKGDLQQDGPALGVTDPKVLRRILMHLLTNAVDVTVEGKIALCIGYKNNRVSFAVTDTGPGLEMPENAAEGDLPVIFQRYHQELLPDETLNLTIATSLRDKIEEGINTHKKNNMGIGLSLTYHLVQALGGEIRCTSEMGEGTKFQFSLPRKVSFNTTVPRSSSLVPAVIVKPTPKTFFAAVKVDDEDDATMCSSEMGGSTVVSGLTNPTFVGGATEEEQRGAKRIRMDVPSLFDMPSEVQPQVTACGLASAGVKVQDPPSILVVEDTTTCAKMLCRLLSKFQCATKWAENGKIAVEILKQAAPGTYDLILMDLRMPIMDGLEATRIIKHQLGIRTPVVALTGDDNEKTREEAKSIGFDGFYGKPLRRDDLKKVLREYTGYNYGKD